MEWIKLPLSRLQSQQFMIAEPQQQAAWVKMLAYCAGQENGGVIAGCREWPPAVWMKVVGIDPEELKGAPCALWDWQGDSLSVWGYCIDEEELLRKKRAGGKRGGTRTPSSTPPRTPSSTASNRIEENREDKNRTDQTQRDTHPDTRFWKSELASLKAEGAKIVASNQADWVDLLSRYNAEAVHASLQALVKAGKETWPAEVAGECVRRDASHGQAAKAKRLAFEREWQEMRERAEAEVQEGDPRWPRVRIILARESPMRPDLDDLRDLLERQP